MVDRFLRSIPVSARTSSSAHFASSGLSFDTIVPSQPSRNDAGPASFLLGWLGTVVSKDKPDEAKWAELEVRALTGIGAEKAVHH